MCWHAPWAASVARGAGPVPRPGLGRLRRPVRRLRRLPRPGGRLAHRQPLTPAGLPGADHQGGWHLGRLGAGGRRPRPPVRGGRQRRGDRRGVGPQRLGAAPVARAAPGGRLRAHALAAGQRRRRRPGLDGPAAAARRAGVRRRQERPWLPAARRPPGWSRRPAGGAAGVRRLRRGGRGRLGPVCACTDGLRQVRVGPGARLDLGWQAPGRSAARR
jgi:hypothetical protein